MLMINREIQIILAFDNWKYVEGMRYKLCVTFKEGSTD